MKMSDRPARPLVDVTLLSWNRASLLQETLENILAQTGIDLNVWVVDQGSQADTIHLLEKYTQAHANIHVTYLNENIGVPAGRNLAMRRGQAEFIFTIDNDAIFESDRSIQTALQLFQTDPRLAVVGFRIENFSTREIDLYSWVYPRQQLAMSREPFPAARFVGCGQAIRRSALDQVGFYDGELFFGYEEIDLSYRLIQAGWRILYSPAITVLHKVSSEQRVEQGAERFYYQWRNMLYVNFRHTKNWPFLCFASIGVLLKGLYQHRFSAAMKGIRDAWKRIARDWSMIRRHTFSQQARDYLDTYEKPYLPSPYRRLRNQLASPLESRQTNNQARQFTR